MNRMVLCLIYMKYNYVNKILKNLFLENKLFYLVLVFGSKNIFWIYDFK